MWKNIISEFPDDFGRDIKTCNDGSGDIYIEPFGGSATVLFHKKPSPIEIYNDLNENVYSLFYVLSKPETFEVFRKRCDLICYSRRIFEEYRDSLNEEMLPLEERAFRFFYVNRVAYNGVGSFSCIVNAVRRSISKPISDMLSAIERLSEIHSRLKSVVVENVDALELIPKYDQSSVLFYLDPPYHQEKRTSVRYSVDMSNEQQERLIEIILKLNKARILLSGYDCKLYGRLVDAGWTKKDFGVKTQSSSRKPKVKTETLWRNYKKGGDK